ncbi:MAG: hypothetical protein ABIW82_08385 [Dokdonella sp.]
MTLFAAGTFFASAAGVVRFFALATLPPVAAFGVVGLADAVPARLRSGFPTGVFAAGFRTAFFTLVFFAVDLAGAALRVAAVFFLATGFALERDGVARVAFAATLAAAFFTAFFTAFFFTIFPAAPLAAFFAAVFFTAARFIWIPLRRMSAPQSSPALVNELATLPFTQLKRALGGACHGANA